MGLIKVTILKQAGETGLRLAGTPMLMDGEKAKKLAAKGLVKLPVKPKKTKKKTE